MVKQLGVKGVAVLLIFSKWFLFALLFTTNAFRSLLSATFQIHSQMIHQ